jgi:hypothetical protein
MKTISISAYAKEKNVSRQYISSLIGKGILKKEKNGQLDPAESDKRINENRDIRRDHLRKLKIPNYENKKKAGQKRKDCLDASRLLKMQMEAKLLELEYEKRSSELCTTAGIEAKKVELACRLREGLLGIPDRLASFSPAQRDEMRAEIHKAAEILNK